MNMISILKNCVNPIVGKNGELYACGQCPLCRRRKMLEWTLRGKHELNTQKGEAIFLTLSYKPKYLPKKGEKGFKIISRCKDDAKGNLNPEDMTLFFKRLRKYVNKKFDGKQIKYIYCGEYGEKRWRPHYHAIIYGLNPWDIPEEKIKQIWGKGIVKLDKGIVTERAIQYTVGYISKKIINRYTKRTEYIEKGRKPPYLRVSKGIGLDWCMRHIDTICEKGTITTSNGEVGVPRYYLKKIKQSEARKITFTQEITDEITGEIIEKQKIYKYIENPEKKYTKMLYDRQLEYSYNNYLKALEDTKNANYFEEAAQYLDDFKNTLKMLTKKVNWHFFTKNKSDKEVIKYYRKKMDKAKYIKEAEKQGKKYRLKTKIPKEQIERYKESAKLKVYTLMNGAFGKRQAFEIGLEMAGT